MDSLETWAVLIEIFMLKFTEWSKTLGMASKKTVLPLKGISSLAGDFVLIWMKQRLIWFNLQRDGTRNGLSNISSLCQSSLQLQTQVYITYKDLFIKMV